MPSLLVSEAKLNIVARAIWACSTLSLAQIREELLAYDCKEDDDAGL
jgi:hypothetical protein